MHPEVDKYLDNAPKWGGEMAQLRTIALECGLTEEWKWRQPCYQHDKKNVVIIGSFKDYCTLSFFKGILLKDAEHILEQQGEHTQSARVVKFTSKERINSLTATLKTYIYEAVEVERAGLKVDFKEKEDLALIDELQGAMASNAELKAAFEGLTPGRQRAYNLYFSGAKHSATRISRIEKYTSRILEGYGFNDCVCGLSKRKPNCDGSHKQLKS